MLYIRNDFYGMKRAYFILFLFLYPILTGYHSTSLLKSTETSINQINENQANPIFEFWDLPEKQAGNILDETVVFPVNVQTFILKFQFLKKNLHDLIFKKDESYFIHNIFSLQNFSYSLKRFAMLHILLI